MTTVNGETDANAQRQALVGSNTGVASVNLASVSETTSQSTDDVTDEAAQINVSVSDPVGVDESTIDVSVTGAGSTTNLVVNGTATDNVTATGSNATFDNDANDSVENINVTAQLPEDKTGYDITVSADDTTGSSISDNTGPTDFTVDMAGDALQVTADSNSAFANTDGDAPAADETANVSVTAIDRFGNELNATDGNINVSSSEIALTSQDGSVSINGPTSGNATRNNATTFDVSDTEVETVTLTALDTNAANSTLTRGSAQQTFTADIAGLDVTTNDSTLPADDTTEAAVTAQLVDSNGEPVPRGGISVSYSIDNSSAAGVSVSGSQSDTTNSNGAATINITADTAGELVTVTAIEQGTGNGFSGETQIETIPGEVSVDNSEFRLNGNLATPANDPTVQVATDHNVSVRVEDDSENPIPGQSVTYTLNGTELTTVTSNDQGYANVTGITLPEEKGDYVLNASAGAFNASSTGDAQINITATAANVSTLRFAEDQQATFAADSSGNTVTIEAADQYGNINESATGTVTLTSADDTVFDFGGSASTTASFSSTGSITVSNLNAGSEAGSTDIEATIPDSDIANTTLTFSVGEPQSIDVTFSSDVSTSSSSSTNQTATVTAQLIGPDGSAIGVANEQISFARQNGNAAELNQSADDFAVKTDSSGQATFQVNATSTTGETTFLAISDNYSAQGTGTITTTGPADGVSLSPAQTSLGVNESTTVTATFVDSEDRTVPRTSSITLSADAGEVTSSSSNATEFVNGVAEAQFTYNASTASANTATLTGVGGGVSGTAVVELTGDTGAASVTFNDQTVANGSTSVTVANYDLGTEGQSVAIWTVSDGSPDQVIGQVNSSELDATNGSDLTVQLDSELTANTTLVAAVHSSTSPSANNIVVQDSASITVQQTDVPQNLQRFAGDDGEIGNLDVLNAVNAANSGGTVGGEPVDNLDILQLVNYVNQQS